MVIVFEGRVQTLSSWRSVQLVPSKQMPQRSSGSVKTKSRRSALQARMLLLAWEAQVRKRVGSAVKSSQMQTVALEIATVRLRRSGGDLFCKPTVPQSPADTRFAAIETKRRKEGEKVTPARHLCTVFVCRAVTQPSHLDTFSLFSVPLILDSARTVALLRAKTHHRHPTPRQAELESVVVVTVMPHRIPQACAFSVSHRFFLWGGSVLWPCSGVCIQRAFRERSFRHIAEDRP